MSRCQFKGRITAPNSLKREQPDCVTKQKCPKIGTYFKPRLQDLKSTYELCPTCSAPTCLACPEKPFINASAIESVSDDLVLLRCWLCELNYPVLSKFVPEPWFNQLVIEERLLEIRKAIDQYCQDTSRSDLVCLTKVLDLITEIDETLEEGDE